MEVNIWNIISNTLPETNQDAPENRPSQKETASYSNLPFSGVSTRWLRFREGRKSLNLSMVVSVVSIIGIYCQLGDYMPPTTF